MLDPEGRSAQTLTGDVGLIAAVEIPEEAPIWVVTGLNEAGLKLAANALDRGALDGHFAVAVTPGGTIPLPAAS